MIYLQMLIKFYRDRSRERSRDFANIENVCDLILSCRSVSFRFFTTYARQTNTY